MTLVHSFLVGGVNNDQTKVAAVGTAIPGGIAYLALQLFERGLSADVLKWQRCSGRAEMVEATPRT